MGNFFFMRKLCWLKKMDIIISKISFSFTVHATEELEKNMHALSNLIKGIDIDQSTISRSRLEGGYGNPIDFVEISYTKSNIIKKIMECIISIISEDKKKKLAFEFENRFNRKKSTFFVRFDKNALYNDIIIITDSANIIKLAIKMRAFNKQAEFKNFLIDKRILV